MNLNKKVSLDKVGPADTIGGSQREAFTPRFVWAWKAEECEGVESKEDS